MPPCAVPSAVAPHNRKQVTRQQAAQSTAPRTQQIKRKSMPRLLLQSADILLQELDVLQLLLVRHCIFLLARQCHSCNSGVCFVVLSCHVMSATTGKTKQVRLVPNAGRQVGRAWRLRFENPGQGTATSSYHDLRKLQQTQSNGKLSTSARPIWQCQVISRTASESCAHTQCLQAL